MTEPEEKNGFEDEPPSPDDEDFNEGALISISGDDEPDDKAAEEDEADKREDKPGSESEADYLNRTGGISVDDVLKDRRPLEIDPPSIVKTKPAGPGEEAPSRDEPDGQDEERIAGDASSKPPEPAVSERDSTSRRLDSLEIVSPSKAGEQWKVGHEDPREIEEKIKRLTPVPLEVRLEERLKVDHESLAKLDGKLKEELQNIKAKAEAAVIPGDFLEARRLLDQEGILECPKCHVKVKDIPGKVDHCPKCGLALDDYFGEFRRNWENKYKKKVAEGVKEFGYLGPDSGKTAWERWKEDQGLDPDAELLVCPKCGRETYDDPFVANKCPECRIPLDLHLQTPRPYIRERERKKKMRRIGVDHHGLKGKPPKK